MRPRPSLPPDRPNHGGGGWAVALERYVRHLEIRARVRAEGLEAVVLNLGGGYRDFLNLARDLGYSDADGWIIGRRDGNDLCLLDAAVQVLEPFFNKNELIVYTKGRKPSDREDFRADSAAPGLRLGPSRSRSAEAPRSAPASRLPNAS